MFQVSGFMQRATCDMQRVSSFTVDHGLSTMDSSVDHGLSTVDSSVDYRLWTHQWTVDCGLIYPATCIIRSNHEQ